MAYACDVEDGNTAALLLTDLETGQSIAMCPLHIAPLMTQFVLATGIQLEMPGQITQDDLVTVATKREMDIDTMLKASAIVRQNRKEELSIVIGELAGLVLPQVVDSDGDAPAGDQGDDDVVAPLEADSTLNDPDA